MLFLGFFSFKKIYFSLHELFKRKWYVSVPKLLKNKSLFQASDCHYSKYFGIVFTYFDESKTNCKDSSDFLIKQFTKNFCVFTGQRMNTN